MVRRAWGGGELGWLRGVEGGATVPGKLNEKKWTEDKIKNFKEN